MCRLKSGIILINRVYVPQHNHHTQMLEELGIEDDYFGMTHKFVRFELSPKENDVFSDINSWIFIADQDEAPAWFGEDKGKYEEMARKAAQEWAAEYVHVGKSGFSIESGFHYLKDCKSVYACNSSTVKAYNSAAVNAYGSATVEAYDSATVEACNSSTVNAYNSSTVNAYNSSTVKAYNSATVKAYDSAAVVIPDCQLIIARI